MERPKRPPVRMFFYGTLKRGGCYHAYCAGGRMAAEAWVEGLLYDLPQGYPAIVVPEETILAVGTGDAPQDARAAHSLGRESLREPKGTAVHGELYVFEDPEERLPAIDALEGFVPGDPSSPYRRVLLPASLPNGAVTPAWTYTARHARGAPLPHGRWPA